MRRFDSTARALSSTALLTFAAMLAAPAQAQDQPVPDQPAAADSEPAQDQVIVVTGSRLRVKNEFNSPSPVAIIDPTVAEKKGVFDTAALLQSNTVAAGSPQITSAISSNFVTDGGPGASTISLRGLGANRTLVLLNGRRAGPAGTRGSVSAFDLNVLPQSIIEQVQIQKDGASSVYGSDAVAGVVNIITKTKTKGIELRAFGSVPGSPGGDQYRLSGTWGTEWAGDHAGHLLVAADYYSQRELHANQRKYLDCAEDYVFSNSGARIDLVNPETGHYRCSNLSWGQVYLYDYSYYYSPNGTNLVGSNGRPISRIGYSYPGENLGQYLPGLATPLDGAQFGAPAGFYGMGYSPASSAVDHLYHPFYGRQTIIPETERLTFYTEGSVELTDHIKFYMEGLWNRRETTQHSFRQFWNYTYTSDFFGDGSTGNPNMAGFTGAVILSPTPITDHNDSRQKVEYWRTVGGLKGDFGSLIPGWEWDGFVQYSKSSAAYTDDQIYKDSVDQQTYRFDYCGVGEVTDVRGVPCININWGDPQFLAGNFTQAQRDYLFGTETGHTKYTQLNIELSANGTLFKAPAGDVALAIGASWRRDAIHDRPGDITYALKAGGNPSDPASYINNSWGNTSSGITAGHNITEEAFAEINLPLFHDTPLVQQFDLSASGRYTQSKATRASDGVTASDKGNWTYKIGLNWKMTDWLRLRGTWGTSYRAPALFELFLADQSSFIGQRNIDPCIQWGTKLATGAIAQLTADHCQAAGVPSTYTGGAATATVFAGGGLGVVHAETSTAKTVSMILTPRFDFLSGTRINLAIDYINIEVKGEISKLGAANIVRGCYASNFYPNEPLCALFSRNTASQTPAYSISTVHDTYINVNRQANEAVDVTLNVSQDLGKLGKLDFTGQMTWQLHDSIALFVGTDINNNGNNGDPRWTGSFNAQWTKGSWSLYYGLDVVGGSSDERIFLEDNPGTLCRTSGASYPAAQGGYCLHLGVKPVFYHNASVTKDFDNISLTAGVTNIFNTRPPQVTNFGNTETQTIGTSVFSSQYDMIGRRFFLSAKAKF